MNHSLINANRNTHAKIALLAVAASVVFVAIAATANLSSSDSARSYGPVVKAAPTTMMATSGASAVR